MSRPYLIIPQFIEQPTWGGDYITNLKGLDKKNISYLGKIGQSYELSSTSHLANNIIDSDDLLASINREKPLASIPISDIETINLLIKLNQAQGNSFQLHIKPATQSARWKPKPESWYFLEDGSITLGVCPGVDVNKYKNICIEIDLFMHSLSKQIKDATIPIEDARKKAQQFVQEKNPWQFVNKYHVKKHSLIDLSMGAIHHSWEEDIENAPFGNVVFEVQIEASDDDATIRSFDQGKIKDDGTVRKLAIEDYFQHLDHDPSHNTISYMKRLRNENSLLRTAFYHVDIVEPRNELTVETKNNYHHLYVRDGIVSVSGNNTTIIVKKGHSCFIPSALDSYTIQQHTNNSVVLKTYPAIA